MLVGDTKIITIGVIIIKLYSATVQNIILLQLKLSNLPRCNVQLRYTTQMSGDKLHKCKVVNHDVKKYRNHAYIHTDTTLILCNDVYQMLPVPCGDSAGPHHSAFG